MRTKAEIAAVLLILWACIAVQVSRGAELTPAQRAKVLLLLEQEQAAQVQLSETATRESPYSPTMPPRGPVTAPQHARGAAQAQRIRPPAAGIVFTSPELADASPLPNWYLCRVPVKALEMLRDPRLVAWSRHFDCVQVDSLGGEVPEHHVDAFLSADGRTYKRFANSTPADVEGYMRRLRDAYVAMYRVPLTGGSK